MSGDYRSRRVLVIGLSRSGSAAARLLASEGAELVLNDRRTREEIDRESSRLSGGAGSTLPPGELVLGSHPKELATSVELIVVSPGVPLDNPILVEARSRSVPVWSEIELAYRHQAGTVVAITGTKGKSTTATLLHRALVRAGRDARLVGNIGAPWSAELEGHGPETVFVVEASSFQLESVVTFRADVALLLDVSPDHLDWHPSFEAYVAAKSRIFERQREQDHALVFGGNPLTVDMASRGKSRKVYFDLECLGELTPHVEQRGPWIVRHENGEVVPLQSLEDFQPPGRHNRLNALAASAAAALLGVSGEDAEEAFAEFEGLPHALEPVAELEGVRYYNDSKATTIVAVEAALASFDAPVLLILGGRFKGGDYGELRESIARRAKRVIVFGESRDRISEALDDVDKVVIAGDLDEAVELAHDEAVVGDVVLLSPGGSSFDMFRDYRQRGERFREIVRGLGGQRK